MYVCDWQTKTQTNQNCEQITLYIFCIDIVLLAYYITDLYLV